MFALENSKRHFAADASCPAKHLPAGLVVLALLLQVPTRPAVAAEFAWQKVPPESRGMDARRLNALEQNLADRGTKGLLIIRGDRIVWEWYAPDHGPNRRHYTASLAKSLVGGMSLLLVLDDGSLGVDDAAHRYIPVWKDDPLKSKITIRHLATHSSGIEDAESPGKSHAELTGWKGDFWKRTPDPFSLAVHQAPVLSEPGTRFAYSNPGMAALSYAVTASLQGTSQGDLRSLLKARIMEPIGIGAEEWSIGYGTTYEVDGLRLVANWGGGSFTARAVARVGRLMLHKGNWQGTQLVKPKWVDEVLSYRDTPLPERPAGNPFPAPALGWYNNSDGVWSHVPRDAFAGAGAGNQVLLVVPSLDLIVVRNGSLISNAEEGEGFWGGLEKHLFNPLMASMGDHLAAKSSPYPPSPVIEGLVWAPPETIVRKAPGSDNWPITWGDDDALYTAYGDGWGFVPKVEKKLSLGLARITGSAESFHGINLRSPTAEQTGQGPAGMKASGMLMVEGVLYMWVRNADNAQLAWSADRGASWTWCDWKFTTSFGAPTFLNFGRNYAGARDAYVYVYSHDAGSAYEPADRMVLARVLKDLILERAAYEFFVCLDSAGQPVWTGDIASRGSVFAHPGHCYRSGISYNRALGRYLWCQTLPASTDPRGPRFQGGFGVYDAPEPWGPWTTVFFTQHWDVGPGETSSFPPKWMSADGKTLSLVFSGDDAFSVRRATVRIVASHEDK